MRTPIGILVTTCALTTALLVTGCGSGGDKETGASGELFLQPVAAQGPDPFTASTATSTATPPRVTRTPQSDGLRSYSGSTPGLYGGTERVGSCDVNRQIGYLTGDPAKARAFAGAVGISQSGIPDYLRGLAPVVLRADTRVTNHGYRDDRTTTHQSVLQAGTAVLVDNRGVPRVRCACGNPLEPPAEMRGSHGTSGRAWSGYRPAQVIVVTRTTQVITNITIINVVNNTWIERRIGHDVHHDRPVPRPEPLTPTPTPTPTPSPDDSLSPNDESTRPTDGTTEPSDERTGPTDGTTTPEGTPTDCLTPTVTVTPGATEDAPTEVPSPAGPTDCPTSTVTATPPTTEPQSPLVPTEEESGTDFSGTVPDEVGPESVPDTPDLPDGGGLIPDDAEDPAASGSIFGSPTDVFDS